MLVFDARRPSAKLGSPKFDQFYCSWTHQQSDGKTSQVPRPGHLYVGGLATDYCVRSTVLDARKAGYEVTVLSDGVAGVDIAAGDSAKAMEEMRRSGVTFCTTDDIARQFAPFSSSIPDS